MHATNDEQLDGAGFISGFRLTSNPGGPDTEPEDMVPEPSNAALLVAGVAFIALALRRQAATRPIRIS